MSFCVESGFSVVAPFAGAWIEITVDDKDDAKDQVAPFAGAWIEIVLHISIVFVGICRSLRGSVD